MSKLRILFSAVLLVSVFGLRTGAAAQRAGEGDGLGSDAVAPQAAVRWVMGTYLRIVVVDPAVDPADAAVAMDEAFAEAEAWNARLSNYDPESPLSEINRRAGEWVLVPTELVTYLARAKEAAARTGGIFDITVGGFALSESQGVEPVIGSQYVELQREGSLARARLRFPNMALDPGGDGKGWAVDAAVDRLREAGIRHALVEFGGSSWYALGHPPQAPAWQIGIADAVDAVRVTAHLRDRALSTSRSARRDSAPLDEADRSGFHILDPRSGERVYVDRTVGVVSTRATDAEVLSTALVVVGRDGFALLSEFPDSEAIVLEGAREPVFSDGAEEWFRPGAPELEPPARAGQD